MIAHQETHLAPPGWDLGKPLGELLEAGPFTAAEATAVMAAVLAALADLHAGGRAHGGVELDRVGLGGDGCVRLAENTGRRRAAPSSDLRDAGRLLCLLLGIEAEEVPGKPTPAAERAAPALVALGRSLARGGEWTAEGARLAVLDAAGLLGREPQLSRALADLSRRAAGESGAAGATRVVIGPPLGTESVDGPPAAAPSLVAAVGALFTRVPELPSLDGSWSRPRPWRRFGRFGAPAAAAFLAAATLGALGGLALNRTGAAPAAAAQASPVRPVRAQPAAPPSPAAAQPQSLQAATPDGAVSQFFALVQESNLDQAALLWTGDMSAQVDLATRFGGVQSVTLQRNDVVRRDSATGTATVAVDWIETAADGSTHEYSGQVTLASGPSGWRWTDWNVSEVAPQDNGG